MLLDNYSITPFRCASLSSDGIAALIASNAASDWIRLMLRFRLRLRHRIGVRFRLRAHPCSAVRLSSGVGGGFLRLHIKVLD